MRIKRKYFILIAAVLSSVLVLSSCQPEQDRVDELESENQSLADLIMELEEQLAELEAETDIPSDLRMTLEEQITELEAENQLLTDSKTELEKQLAEVEADNQSLAGAIADLEEQVTELEAQLHSLDEQQEITRAPNEGWEDYFPAFDQTTLEGETTQSVEELLGKPPYMIRSIAVNPEFSREIWVFIPYQEDPTGLYLFFQGSRLTDSRLDEFQGLFGSGLLDDEDFWR